LNALDDTLSTVLDFAFNDTYGYQAAAFDEVGTGFRVTAFVHLPALTLLKRQLGLEQQLRERRHVFAGAFGPVSEGLGDLYALANQATLGCSEEEVAYHVQHAAADLIGWETDARETLLREGLRGMEDRVGRAQGVARGARLLGFEEAVALLSSLRLGVSTGILEGHSYECLNDLLVGCQRGHLEVRAGQDHDELTLSMERADLFRARLS
jgi:protein arginine kinase